MHSALDHWLRMSFPDRLTALRKQHSLTQQALANALGMHLSQIKRYENGTSQPSLEALKKIALTFSISTDELIFDDTERGPDEALRMKFEAIRQFDKRERQLAEGMLDSLINNHQAKRLFGAAAPTKPAAKKPARQERRAGTR